MRNIFFIFNTQLLTAQSSLLIAKVLSSKAKSLSSESIIDKIDIHIENICLTSVSFRYIFAA